MSLDTDRVYAGAPTRQVSFSFDTQDDNARYSIISGITYYSRRSVSFAYLMDSVAGHV
jgi:hypothetical protein